jgi:hypothetical protein
MTFFSYSSNQHASKDTGHVQHSIYRIALVSGEMNARNLKKAVEGRSKLPRSHIKYCNAGENNPILRFP